MAEDQVIAGNTLLYGATSGALYARGGRVGGNDSRCATRARSLWWKASATMRAST